MSKPMFLTRFCTVTCILMVFPACSSDQSLAQMKRATELEFSGLRLAIKSMERREDQVSISYMLECTDRPYTWVFGVGTVANVRYYDADKDLLSEAQDVAEFTEALVTGQNNYAEGVIIVPVPPEAKFLSLNMFRPELATKILPLPEITEK